MPIASLISRTRVNTLPESNIIRNITLTPDVIYTCPAGKKAKITGEVRCVDRGAAANASFEAGGVVFYRWDTNASQVTIDSGYLKTPNDMTTFSEMPAQVDLILQAGQFIRVIQNSGTNAQFKVNLQVLELPA